MRFLVFILLAGCFTPEIQVSRECLTFKYEEVTFRGNDEIFIYHFTDKRGGGDFVEHSLIKRNYKVGECISVMLRK